MFLCYFLMCVCLCSDEDLNKYLDDKESTVLIEDFVRNLDAVSLVQPHGSPAHDDVMSRDAIPVCCLKVKKVQSDRNLLFQENEDQARKYMQ